MLVISSELPELLGICDRIYTLSAGHITGEVPRAEATQEILMQYMTRDNEHSPNCRRKQSRTPTTRCSCSRPDSQHPTMTPIDPKKG